MNLERLPLWVAAAKGPQQEAVNPGVRHRPPAALEDYSAQASTRKVSSRRPVKTRRLLARRRRSLRLYDTLFLFPSVA